MLLSAVLDSHGGLLHWMEAKRIQGPSSNSDWSREIPFRSHPILSQLRGTRFR